MKINTLLFDLDGTLIDSNELILESFRRTFVAFQPEKTYGREKLLEMMGPPLYDTFRVVSSDPIIIQSMIDFYRKTYIRLEFEYIKIYPYTLDMLEHFKNQGFNLAIVTTKFLDSALPSIRAYHLDEYFDVVISLDDVKNHKPHPEPVLKALSAFTHMTGAVMIGDNYSDLLSGKNAGILTCGLDWSLKKESLKEMDPTFWIHNFKELIELIDNYNKEVF